MDEPPITNVDEPFAALVGFIADASVLWPSLTISLFVVVELLDSDSLRGGCNECCVSCVQRAATGRESI